MTVAPMSAITEFDVQSQIRVSVTETFGTMLSMEIEPLEAEPPPGQGIHRIVGTLNLAGRVNGLFNVQVTVDFGRLMAAGMLGMEPAEVDPASDVRDLIAEITNIVGGNLKSALNDAGHACVLSTPSITFGTDFTIRSLNMDRFERFVFKHAEHLLIVEVGLKAVEGSDTGLDFSTPDAMSRMPNVDIERLNGIDYQERTFGCGDERLRHHVLPAAEAGGKGHRIEPDGNAQRVLGVLCRRCHRHRQHPRRPELSRLMAAGMLGMEPEEIEGHAEIQDILGELGNIVGGNLKSALTDAGLRCALSTPSFTTGADFMIESLNLERYERYAFALRQAGPCSWRWASRSPTS